MQQVDCWEGRINGGKMINLTRGGGQVEPGLEIVRLELKYCERCGGLWTREHGIVQSRCDRCIAEEKQLTKLWKSRSKRFNMPASRTGAVLACTGAASAGLAWLGSKPTMTPGGLPA
jgi:hypothetical protein